MRNVFPKFNGKKFDEINQRKFDHWKKQFLWAITHSNQGVSDSQAEVMAHNCASTVVWYMLDKGISND